MDHAHMANRHAVADRLAVAWRETGLKSRDAVCLTAPGEQFDTARSMLKALARLRRDYEPDPATWRETANRIRELAAEHGEPPTP